MKRFNLRKLNELEVRKEYQSKISNSFAALENLSDTQDINRAWENINENIKTSAKESLGLQELKQHKPWFDKECLGFLDQRKQAKMQWIQDPSRSNADNLNNVSREEADISGTKRRNIWKAKIDYIDSNDKINSITDLHRGSSDFKKGCHLRTNIVKDEKGDFFTDSSSILARWRKHYSQLLNVLYMGLMMLRR